MKLTPKFLVSFEHEIGGLVTGNWQRVVKALMWDRLMKVRPMSGKVQILTWLLESARLYREGDGGNKRFDDIVATSTALENGHVGSGLKLTKDEIEDNQLKDNPSVGALDYARKWASDIGADSAYYPQRVLFELILAGTTSLGYDGVPFFAKTHPINPEGGGGVFSNIVENVPLVVTSGASEQDNLLIGRKNLGKALAHVRKQRFVHGVPRFLRPTVLAVQTDLFDYANLLVSAGVIGQTDNVKTAQLEVLACPELDDDTPGTFYIGVEDLLSDELGAFIYGLRSEFAMNTFSPMTESDLANKDEFLWRVDGRNTATYGHPYLFYRCLAGAAP